MNRRDFQALAIRRLAEATVLFENRMYVARAVARHMDSYPDRPHSPIQKIAGPVPDAYYVKEIWAYPRR